MKYKVGISKTKRKRGSSLKNVKRTFRYRKINKYSKKTSTSGRAKNRKPWKFGLPSKMKSKKFKKTASKVVGVFFGIGVLVTLGGVIFLGATLASIKKSLPEPDKLITWKSAQSTKVYDRGGPEDGELLYTFYGEQNREFAKIDKYPEHTKWALLAAEDMEFYDHKGLDLPGLAVAGYENVILKKRGRGASTITQQLVRNTLLFELLGEEAYERSYLRKVKEALITMQIEQTLSKDEILQMYMNEIPLGGTNYGFQASAKAYFGKDVKDLSLAESAMLAGIIQAPGLYSPLFGTNPEEATTRQHYVLDQMYKNREYIKKSSKKYGDKELNITKEMIDEAKKEELVYKSVDIDINAPHFVFYVKQTLIEKYGIDVVEKGGLKVTTTLDYDIQKIAEQEIKKGVDNYKSAYNVHNGSMVVLDPKTNQIIAMVGSYDYNKQDSKGRVDGKVNIATSLRQMGSSVKPYTYLTAFNQGYSPALLTPDIPFKFGYKAENWDGNYLGLLLAREALVKSRNISALYTLDLVGGPDEFVKSAEKLGITTLTDRDRYGLSITLGAGEMKLLEHANAFAAFANKGVQQPATPILKVETSDGEVLDEWSEENSKRVWDNKEIYLLNWTLCDLASQGRITPEYYKTSSGQKLCGKTGTTNGPTDLVSILYYPNLVVAVWTGNNNNDFTIGSRGQGWSTTVPLPIAHSFMSRVIGKYGKAWYSRPSGIVSGTVCKDTGQLAKSSSSCPKVSSVFIKGHLPSTDTSYVKKAICKETGKVATNESQASKLGLIEYRTYLKIKLPISKHQAALDAWLSKSKKYGSTAGIPEEAECPLHLGPDNAPTISFLSPSNGAELDRGESVTLSAAVNSLNGVTKVEFYFDGSSVGTENSAPYSMTYTIPSSTSIGGHTFSAKVTDTEGKTGNTSINVSVTDPSAPITVVMTSPSDGSSFTLPRTLTARISGDFGTVTSLTFNVQGPTSKTISASSSDGGQNWSASWTGSSAGSYSVKATAVSGGTSYSSGWINVTVE